MFSENQSKARIGKVSIDIKANRYRIRFTYPHDKEDAYKTKIEIASEIITELVEFGFNIELVLADSLYGEASSLITTLNKYKIPWVLAIRNNHGVWMPANQKVRANKFFLYFRLHRSLLSLLLRIIPFTLVTS